MVEEAEGGEAAETSVVEGTRLDENLRVWGVEDGKSGVEMTEAVGLVVGGEVFDVCVTILSVVLPRDSVRGERAIGNAIPHLVLNHDVPLT